MSTVNSSMFKEPGMRASASEQRASRLSTLVYRSRCVEPWSPDDLGRLVDASRVRNRAASVTGLLICEDDRFFQWLEGPTERLARLWRSIRQDRRHTDIEILGDAPTPVRFFGDWDMKLATKCSLNPQTVQRATAGFAVSRAGSVPVPGSGGPWSPPDHHLVSALAEHPSVGELAHLSMAADPDASSLLIDELHAHNDSMPQLCATLFEPAARFLGNLWSADDCSEFDVTFGLCRLQSAVRALALNRSASPRVMPVSRLHSVLVVPMPGEMHSLGAALDAELLWQAGWDMRCERPDTDAALCRLLAGQWFDALDVSLSAAFEREHWLPRLTQTIAFARAASRNPALRVVVSGRAFFEQPDRHTQVGADAACMTAQRIESVLSGMFETTA